MLIAKRLVCCAHAVQDHIIFNSDDRIMTYNGLENLILNSNFDGSGRSMVVKEDDCSSEFVGDDSSSCSSSSVSDGTFPSSASSWKTRTVDEDRHGDELNEWGGREQENSSVVDVKQKPALLIKYSEGEMMKEKFAKLLLGDDVSGGRHGMPSSLALSKAITKLSASVFGERSEVKTLSEEGRRKWCMEMDWFLSPAQHMVELVSSKQECNDGEGRGWEIMVSRTRSDISTYLPALQTLDSMLIDMMDVDELPSSKAKYVYQIFKATKSIHQNVLQEMPIPPDIRHSIPRSGKVCLGVELYKILTSGLHSPEATVESLGLRNDHDALEIINKLEAAVLAWKGKSTATLLSSSSSSMVRIFKKDPHDVVCRMEQLVRRAETLLEQIKLEFPALPPSFLDASKVQYGKDVGHSILEAYSRVLKDLSFKVLCGIGDLLREKSSDEDLHAGRVEWMRFKAVESTVRSHLF